MAADVASVQFSRTVERRERRPVSARFAVASSVDASSRVPAGAGLSKLNSMLASFAAVAGAHRK
jgi:hypothetical protein